MATGGLTVAVMLCLVAAISLLNFSPPELVVEAVPAYPAPRPIEVASTGEVSSHLLNELPAKLVPDPMEHFSPVEPARPPQQFASAEPDHPQQWTPRPDGEEPHYEELPALPDSDPSSMAAETPSLPVRSKTSTTDLEQAIAQLKGQVNELAQSQLEAQLAEIRHAEQLLSAHQTQRMIETLQREVDELKRQQTGRATSSDYSPEAIESELNHLVPPIDQESAHNASVESHEPAQTPALTDSVPVETASPQTAASALPTPLAASLTRVRYAESATSADRYDVTADQASLEEFLVTLGPVAGWNLVNGPELKGSVTCQWKGVELKQALVQLLRVHGRQIRQDGDFAIVEALPSPESVTPADANHEQAPLGPITLQLSTDHSERNPASGARESHGSSLLPIREVHGVRSPLPVGTESTVPQSPNFSVSPAPASARRGRIVMKDYPALMALPSRDDSSSDQPLSRIEIEATILQLRHVPGTPLRAFCQALTVAGQGPCPRCGEVHIGAVHHVGHSSEGWVNLGYGISTGVCLLTTESITSKLKQLATTSATTLPGVQVLDRQRAVIGLTEQQGFHRQRGRHDAGSTDADSVEDDLQLSLRPTMIEDGQIRLDLHPDQSPSGDFNASLIVPANSCVLVGGLFFESDQSLESADHPPSWVKAPEGNPSPPKELFEVVILIHVRPFNGNTTAERPGLPVSTVPDPLLLTR